MLATLRGKIIIFLAVHPPNLTHIIAHKAAYEASVLHRDISPSNILIFGKGKWGDFNNQHESTIDGGMLIDWDLSKINCESDKDSITHQHACIVSRSLKVVYLAEISFHQGT